MIEIHPGIQEPEDSSQAHLVRLDLRKMAKNIRVADDTLQRTEARCEEKMSDKSDDNWMNVSPNWLISVVHELMEHRKAAGIAVPSGREMIERYIAANPEGPHGIC